MVRLDEPRRDLEQRRLAGAVAADQAHPLRSRHSKLDTIEERRAAEGERDVAELDERRGHSAGEIGGMRGRLYSAGTARCRSASVPINIRRTVCANFGFGTLMEITRRRPT